MIRPPREHDPGSRVAASAMPCFIASLQDLPGHSVRSAFIGSMLAARRAGMNPATAANSASTSVAVTSANGSYARTP